MVNLEGRGKNIASSWKKKRVELGREVPFAKWIYQRFPIWGILLFFFFFFSDLVWFCLFKWWMQSTLLSKISAVFLYSNLWALHRDFSWAAKYISAKFGSLKTNKTSRCISGVVSFLCLTLCCSGRFRSEMIPFLEGPEPCSSHITVWSVWSGQRGWGAGGHAPSWVSAVLSHCPGLLLSDFPLLVVCGCQLE